MKLNVRGVALALAAAAALPAAAHHSFAMFDATKTMTLEGSVRQFQWTNPHSWLYLTVADASGKSEDWPIEMGAPSGMARQGWLPKTLTAGMKVKVQVHPLKDGKPGGQFVQITLPDGKQMGMQIEGPGSGAAE